MMQLGRSSVEERARCLTMYKKGAQRCFLDIRSLDDTVSPSLLRHFAWSSFLYHGQLPRRSFAGPRPDPGKDHATWSLSRESSSHLYSLRRFQITQRLPNATGRFSSRFAADGTVTRMPCPDAYGMVLGMGGVHTCSGP